MSKDEELKNRAFMIEVIHYAYSRDEWWLDSEEQIKWSCMMQEDDYEPSPGYLVQEFEKAKALLIEEEGFVDAGPRLLHFPHDLAEKLMNDKSSGRYIEDEERRRDIIRRSVWDIKVD